MARRVPMGSDETRKPRTAGAAGWHASRYNVMAQVPGTGNTAIYNTYRRSCGQYSPLETYLLSELEGLPEGHPIIEGA